MCISEHLNLGVGIMAPNSALPYGNLPVLATVLALIFYHLFMLSVCAQ